MQQAFNVFRANIASAQSMVGLYSGLSAATTQALDASDLLRGALVGSVSALDHLVHELVRIGLLEIANSTRSPATGSGKFSVSFTAVFTPRNDLGWLDAEIRQKHGWLSFQDPDKIADAIRLISNCEIWPAVAAAMSISSAKDVKDQLKLIVDRRNKIAHEADIDPGAYGQKWPISVSLTNDAISFVESVGSSIYTLVR